MAKLIDILSFLENELEHSKYHDSSLNGLQVEGSEVVQKICTAVDSGLSVIEEAVQRKAEFLLVHHGLFWGGSMPIVGIHKRAVEAMLRGGLSLYAAHIPLDANPTYGNNHGLARILGLEEIRPCAEYHGQFIGAKGQNNKSLEELIRKIETLGEGPLTVLQFGPKTPKSIAIVTGSGADELYKFEVDGFDTLITGEPRQSAYHFAKERGLNFIAAGHYRTETVGVKLLGEEISRRFNLTHEFIDQPTGI